MNRFTAAEGGCSCGTLRYRMTASPLIVHACHCRQCQRITGSAFVLNALVKKTELEHLSGELASIRFENTIHTAYFCPTCATYVRSEYRSGRFDDCWFVRVGTLDEPDRFPPDVHIFLSSKQPWMPVPTDTPGFDRFYRIEEVWRADSVRRMGPDWRPAHRD